MEVSKNGLVETGKSVLRALYFALLGVVVLALTSVATSPDVAQATITVFGYTFNVGALVVAGVAALAKIIDRYIHTSENTDSKGIAPTFLQR